MTDEDYIAAFEAGTLDPKTFSHEAHVRLGWLYVTRYPLTEAIARFSGGLRAFAAAIGVPGKYHETITWFYMLLIAERQALAGATSFEKFLAANGDLVGEPSILWDYYSKQAIASEAARHHYVLPDKGRGKAA